MSQTYKNIFYNTSDLVYNLPNSVPEVKLSRDPEAYFLNCALESDLSTIPGINIDTKKKLQDIGISSTYNLVGEVMKRIKEYDTSMNILRSDLVENFKSKGLDGTDFIDILLEKVSHMFPGCIHMEIDEDALLLM